MVKLSSWNTHGYPFLHPSVYSFVWLVFLLQMHSNYMFIYDDKTIIRILADGSRIAIHLVLTVQLDGLVRIFAIGQQMYRNLFGAFAILVVIVILFLGNSN